MFQPLSGMFSRMGIFLYFACGSNMLKERLTATTRCPSARFFSTAYAPDHMLAFTKRSLDLSGKATLTKADGLHQYGVLFEIDDHELPSLDGVEGCGNGYERDQIFPVIRSDGTQVCAVTYMASNPEPNLIPYDWYLALIVAGAKQHGLPGKQIEALQTTVYESADMNQRAINGRRDAMDALTQAGFDSLASVLDQELS